MDAVIAYPLQANKSTRYLLHVVRSVIELIVGLERYSKGISIYKALRRGQTVLVDLKSF